jgi:uncharacterized protein
MSGMTRLVEVMKGYGKAAVAFSGGADSSLVALASVKSYGQDALGIMIRNRTIPASDLESAKEVASSIGLELIFIDVDVLKDKRMLSNPSDRCALCRKISIPVLIEKAGEMGYSIVADGANVDDLDDFRPGHNVSTSLGIKHPLIDAELGKKEVRQLLKDEGMPVSDKPSSPCLATRIPTNEKITVGKLELIDRMEMTIRDLGFRDVRFRILESLSGGFIGIVEVDDPERALGLWKRIEEGSEGISVYLDPRGYRRGSMNKAAHP